MVESPIIITGRRSAHRVSRNRISLAFPEKPLSENKCNSNYQKPYVGVGQRLIVPTKCNSPTLQSKKVMTI